MASGRNGDKVGDTDPGGNLIRRCRPPGHKGVAHGLPREGQRPLFRMLLSASWGAWLWTFA